MLSLKTAAYKKSDYAILIDAIESAIEGYDCCNDCDYCPNKVVCADLMRLKAFTTQKYAECVRKKEH